MLSRFRRAPSEAPGQTPKAQPALGDCLTAFDDEFAFVFRCLRRFGLSAVDAEDVAQDVFVVMLRRWGDFDPQRPLRPWLLGITNRVALHHLRRAWRETPSGFLDRRHEGPAQEDQVTAQGARRLVSRALTELKDKQREVLVLHEIEGMPMADIARATGEPLQTLYSRLKSAHRAFGRAVRRIGRFPTGTAAVLPLPLESWFAWERARPPAPPAAHARALARARATVEKPGGEALVAPRVSPPRPGLVYATGGALLLAGALGVATGARLLAADGLGWAVAAASAHADPRALRPALETEPNAGRRPGPRTLPSPWALAPAPPGRRVLESLGTNLVGYWRFDDLGAGKGARDFSGNGTDCQVQGPDTPEAGQDFPQDSMMEGPALSDTALGSAMAFGGRTWLECPQPRFHRERTDQLTVALWVRAGRLRQGYRTLVTRQLGQSRSDHFFLGIAHRRLLLQSDAFGGRVLGPALTPGAWTHVVATWRDGTTTLYVDGLEVGHAQGPRTAEPDLSAPLLIGAGINGPAGTPASQKFRGALDELLVYDRALGPEEVAALASGVQPHLSF